MFPESKRETGYQKSQRECVQKFQQILTECIYYLQFLSVSSISSNNQEKNQALSAPGLISAYPCVYFFPFFPAHIITVVYRFKMDFTLCVADKATTSGVTLPVLHIVLFE